MHLHAVWMDFASSVFHGVCHQVLIWSAAIVLKLFMNLGLLSHFLTLKQEERKKEEEEHET